MENSQHNILLFLHMQCLEQMLSLRLHHLPVSPPVPLSMVHYSHSLPGRHLRNHSDPQSAISSACKFSVPYLTLATSWGWIKQWLRCCINVRFHGFMVLNRESWFYCNSHMCVCLLNKIVPWFFLGAWKKRSDLWLSEIVEGKGKWGLDEGGQKVQTSRCMHLC